MAKKDKKGKKGKNKSGAQPVRKRSLFWHPVLQIPLLLVAGFVAGIIIIGLSSDTKQKSKSKPKPKVEACKEFDPADAPGIESVFEESFSSIEINSKEGDCFSIEINVVAVDSLTPENARQSADNIIRFVKSLGPDTSPGKEVGTGQYHYDLTMLRSDGSVYLRATKSKLSTRVTFK